MDIIQKNIFQPTGMRGKLYESEDISLKVTQITKNIFGMTSFFGQVSIDTQLT